MGRWDWLPLNVFWNGQAAVVFFLLLSGFGLTRALRQREPSWRNYLRFVATRLVRIFPTYWASLVLALAIRYLLYHAPGWVGWSEWVRTLWSIEPTWQQLLGHLLLIGPSVDTRVFNPVIWVLVVDLRMSLLMPAIVWGLLRAKSRWAMPTALSAAFFLSLGFPALLYLPLFVAGFFLSQEFEALVARFRRLGIWRWPLVLAAAELCAVVRASDTAALPYPAAIVLAAAGCAVLMVAAAAIPSWARRLESPISLRMANDAYAFYLVHLPVLLAVASWWPSRGPLEWLAGAVLALAVAGALAHLIQATIERPALLWSRAHFT